MVWALLIFVVFLVMFGIVWWVWFSEEEPECPDTTDCPDTTECPADCASDCASDCLEDCRTHRVAMRATRKAADLRTCGRRECPLCR